MNEHDVQSIDREHAWNTLCARAAGCRGCGLGVMARNKVVARPANWRGQRRLVLVGEAPGKEEDACGLPFVGKSGRLLGDELQAAGIIPKMCYVMNCIQCRPPNNRDPEPQELAACRGFLVEKLKLVECDLLVAVGRFAAQQLLGVERFAITREAGREHPSNFSGICLPTFVVPHPSWAQRGGPGTLAEFHGHIQRLARWLQEKGVELSIMSKQGD